MWDSECGMWDLEYRKWSREYEMWNPEKVIRNRPPEEIKQKSRKCTNEIQNKSNVIKK